MRKFIAGLLAAVLLFAGNSFSQKAKSNNVFAALDTALQRVLTENHAAGFAVAVVNKNEIVYAKGFGYRDYEKKLPVTPNTVFAIGSCTKAFTACLLGQLNKDNLVDFDKPVTEYLPALRFYNDEMTNKITLRDMMCHRTGLPRHDYSWYLFSTPSRDSLVQRIRYMEPSAGLRQKWQYNNFMFLLQGVVAEKLTGRSWEANIKDRFFAPLGMSNSSTSIEELVKNAEGSIGYGLEKDSIIAASDYYHIDAMGPAGSINSSVNDMAKWVTAWINGGKYNGKEIIPAGYLPQAISSQMIIDGALPTKENPDIFLANYGFGWFLSSYRGHYRVEHGGNIDGFSANTSFFPTDSIGIIVLSNQNGSAVPTIVRNLVADRVLHLKYTDWQTDRSQAMAKAKKAAKEAENVKLSNKKAGTKPSHSLKEYEGLYKHPAYGTMELVSRGDSLFAVFNKQNWWLQHVHYDVFEPFQRNKAGQYDTSEHSTQLQFDGNTAGEIVSLQLGLEPTLKPLVFTRSPKAKPLTKEELDKFAGEYLLSGIALKVFIKGEKTLYLFVPGQPEYELVPVDTNKFALKGVDGFTILFNADTSGKITELLSIQPNGTFKATRKN
jgi:CubicO group peptidase (beta-lactamase class C family)